MAFVAQGEGGQGAPIEAGKVEEGVLEDGDGDGGPRPRPLPGPALWG